MTRTIAEGLARIALVVGGSAVVVLSAGGPIVLAQDATTSVENRVGPPPGSLTPQALVGKSIQDLAHGRIDATVNDDVKALRRGPLLIHGNFCGIGNRPGGTPIDALDAACMRHDACTKTGSLPSCACDERLRVEAAAIAQDTRTRPDVQAIALATASAMAVLICKETPAPAPATVPAAPAAAAPIVVAPDH